jgi:hypothetical protein
MVPLQVETLKPGAFTFKESTDTVAIFRQTNQVNLFFGQKLPINDSLINKKPIPNYCVNSLADYLQEQKYFSKVTNYQDTAGKLDSVVARKDGDDLFILLKKIQFDLVSLNASSNSVINIAKVNWVVGERNDSLWYSYTQADTLYFDENNLPTMWRLDKMINHVLASSGEYLGKAFGTKLIPSWIKVERAYYRSNNIEMLKAEKCARQNEWLKAAEIWNKQTKSKNPSIVAKACYNMALACEMEGKPDLAIDWLVRSYSALKNDLQHKAMCQKYIALMAIRKKEIEKLTLQMVN